ncbi:hypothetical protein O6H91_Y019200 [Diphasiastrum complanatum]|nr:hypothetical protein O6H91_Y019200 [Diphasiastrum complanatum]
MGKAKTSRKGKKAWRKNISTQDVDEFVEKAAREARSGGPLLDLPDDSLFFVDKSKDERLEPKRNKHRIKVLHCDSILQRNSLIAPLLEPRKRNRKRKLRDVAKPVVKGAQSNILKNPVEERNQAYDIWAKEGTTRIRLTVTIAGLLVGNWKRVVGTRQSLLVDLLRAFGERLCIYIQIIILVYGPSSHKSSWQTLD